MAAIAAAVPFLVQYGPILAQLALEAIPEVEALVSAITNLRTAHPGLTDAQVVAFCQGILATVNTTTTATDAALAAELNKPKV